MTMKKAIIIRQKNSNVQSEVSELKQKIFRMCWPKKMKIAEATLEAQKEGNFLMKSQQ